MTPLRSAKHRIGGKIGRLLTGQRSAAKETLQWRRERSCSNSSTQETHAKHRSGRLAMVTLR